MICHMYIVDETIATTNTVKRPVGRASATAANATTTANKHSDDMLPPTVTPTVIPPTVTPIVTPPTDCYTECYNSG